MTTSPFLRHWDGEHCLTFLLLSLHHTYSKSLTLCRIKLKTRMADEFQQCKVMTPWRKKKFLTLNIQCLVSESLATVQEQSPRATVLWKYQLHAQRKEESHQTTVTTSLYKTPVWTCLECCEQFCCSLQKDHRGASKDTLEDNLVHQAWSNGFYAKNDWLAQNLSEA